ncbi:MAG: radical SAM protein [Candidatus Coatesbacteria bacterium]|nr:radical SAM protein [Candidatus Coatesbacteria bacterium]
MTIKFLLVRPDIIEHHLDTRESGKRLGESNQPMGLLYLGTVLKQAGIDILICDEIVEDDYSRMLQEYDPDFVGVTITSPMWDRAKEIVREAKIKNKKVVLGGPHMNYKPQERLEESGADFVCYGEGEETIVEITHKNPSDILGIAYWDNGTSKLNPPRPVNNDLDSIPIPDRSLIDLNKYQRDEEFGWPLPLKGRQIFRIFSSRGCPFQCTFCASWRIFGRKIRYRSPENVLEEVRECREKFGAEYIMFIDDTFTEDSKRMRSICEGLKQMNIHWACYSRVGVPEDDLRLMKESGCEMIGFGVENGSAKVLKTIKKAITPARIEETFKICQKLRFPVKANWMVGLPDEDEKEFRESLEFAKKLNPPFIMLSILIPLPGSEVYDKMLADPAYLPGINKQSYFHSDDPVIQKRHSTFINEYYIRPRYLLNIWYYRNFRYWSIYYRMIKAYFIYRKIERKKATAVSN